MQFVPAFGALRTVGFGRTKSVEVTTEETKSTSNSIPIGPTLYVRLAFDRPLCLVGRKHDRNHFESNGDRRQGIRCFWRQETGFFRGGR